MRKLFILSKSGGDASAVISGSYADGETLTAVITPTPDSATYQWQEYISDVWTNVSGATSSTWNITTIAGTAVRCLVTANYNKTSNQLTTPPVAPSLSVAPSISDATPKPGATVTITEGVYTGASPITITGSLMLGAADVTSNMSGLDYTIPGATPDGTILQWSETATNSGGTDSGAPRTTSVTVTVDAPTFAVSNQSVVNGVGPFTLDLATFMTDDGGDSSITYGLTPQAGVSLDGSVLTFVDTVGTYSNVAVSATNDGGTTNDTFNFEITSAADVTAPILSLPTGAANGSTGATSLGVTTDEGNGTLYWGIYPTASTPSAADVVAGTGATVSGSQAVSGTGVQSVTDQSGLTASTAYKAHYVHDDAAANRSNLATSAEFTTGAAATAPAQFGSGDWSVASGDTQATVTITALPSDGGAAITAIEYQLDGGSWGDSGRTTTGAFTITGLTNLIEYQVALRAVNAVGNGTASATKAVTPAEGTLSLGYDPDGTAIVGLIDGTDVIITIDGEAGSPFTVAQSSLSDGFHILGTADVTGTDGVGNTWTAVVPLHVYTTAEGAPVITYQWVDADDVEISGATGPTYVQQAGDDTDGLSVIMTFTNGNGTVGTAEADAIVPPPPASAVVSGYTGTMNTTSDATYNYYELEDSGTLTFSTGGSVDIELIGGGAGGGARKGGGGGAGARVLQTGVTVGAQGYAVVIGAAGSGAVYTVSDSTDGGTTTFDAAGFNYQSGGGGRGGSFGFVTEGGDAPATIGGGGGGSRYGLSTEGVSNGAGVLGYDGGLDSTGASNVGGGGGGGMGGDGVDAAVGVIGVGGAGVTSYLGDTVCIGGDGGHNDSSAPSAPTAAGSGGHGGIGTDPNRSGTDGVAGRVVIRIAK